MASQLGLLFCFFVFLRVTLFICAAVAEEVHGPAHAQLSGNSGCSAIAHSVCTVYNHYANGESL